MDIECGGDKIALHHEAERAASQEAVLAKSNDQALSTFYAQEVGRRQNCESEIAHLQQKLQQGEDQREVLQTALAAARQETADAKAMASQYQVQLAHANQQRKHAGSSEKGQLAERQQHLDDQEQQLSFPNVQQQGHEQSQPPVFVDRCASSTSVPIGVMDSDSSFIIWLDLQSPPTLGKKPGSYLLGVLVTVVDDVASDFVYGPHGTIGRPPGLLTL
ncbi:hypothetical protein WJX82_010262 [Trebouxia sp. C0006]